MSAQQREATLALVDHLLSLASREEQTAYLRGAGLLSPEGLERLLDAAERLLGDDPGRARLLAGLCAGVAAEADAPAAVPRACYVRAGAHNANGEFEEDLRLTRMAHDGYMSLGMSLEALRTNVGKMDALLELGRYGEALEAGREVLDALAGRGPLEVAPTARERDLLAALVNQNRGICLEYMGRYDEALDAYAAAEERYRSLGMVERLGDINLNRGAILLYLGRGSEGLAAQEAAADIYESAGLAAMHAKAVVNIGEAHLRLGNYARSLEAFERARGPLEAMGELSDRYLLLRHTADAYLELNLYSEALATYREAVDALRGAGMAHDLAHALWGKGAALVAVARLDEAEEALAEAADLFAAAGNSPQLSGVMLERASLRAAGGDREAAVAMTTRALELVSGAGCPVHLVYAHLRLADLLLPDAAAESHLRAARRLVEHLGLPQLRYRLNERLGRLRRAQGRRHEARAALEAAVEDIERLRGTVSQETARASFLRDKTIAYEELLRLHLDEPDERGTRRAFSVAERVRSRALVDLITGVVGAGSAPGDPGLENGVGELQADLNATYARMLAGSADGDGGVSLSRLRARAAELERGISRLRLHAAASGAAPEDPFAGPTVLEEVEERLPSDAVLLAYQVAGEEVLAFVRAGGGLRVARRLGEVREVRRLLRRLSVQWDRFRAGKEFAGRHAALLERSARQVLADLYAGLFGPLEPLLSEAFRACGGADSRLAIVPHGPLHQVPFHALFDGERYLIERFEISYAPSATIFALCQDRAPREGGRALVLGVEDPLIPATIDEALAVSRHLPGSELRVGEEATVGALREAAPGCGVLHLATHGLFRADNPMFSALKLHDGWLAAADVMGLDLSGALVTLSACESGRNEVIEGDEILGLTRAFLGAGAATLVVGLWAVQDETTAALMERWYARLRAGMGRAAALRAAQLELRAEHPHPYYWAPFALIGRR